MNPPYGPDLSKFVDRLLLELAGHPAWRALTLTNVILDTRAGERLVTAASQVLFWRRRIRFIDPASGEPAPGGQPRGQMICALGPVNPPQFRRAFAGAGYFVTPNGPVLSGRPTCPHCGGTASRNGRDYAGRQKYICRVCERSGTL